MRVVCNVRSCVRLSRGASSGKTGKELPNLAPYQVCFACGPVEKQSEFYQLVTSERQLTLCCRLLPAAVHAEARFDGWKVSVLPLLLEGFHSKVVNL